MSRFQVIMNKIHLPYSLNNFRVLDELEELPDEWKQTLSRY